MPGLDLEAIGTGQALSQRGELLVRYLNHLAASTADEVLMAFLGQVVGRGSVTEVDVVDHAEVLEGDEVAVDRGVRHVGMAGFDFLHDVLGAQVPASTEQNGDRCPPAQGGSSPPATHLIQDGLDRIGVYPRHDLSLETQGCSAGEMTVGQNRLISLSGPITMSGELAGLSQRNSWSRSPRGGATQHSLRSAELAVWTPR